MANEQELIEEALNFLEQLPKKPNALYAIKEEITKGYLKGEGFDMGYIREKVKSAKNTLDQIEKDMANAYKLKKERELKV